MKEVVLVYGAAALWALAVWVLDGVVVDAVVSGFAFVGVVMLLWIVADEVKSRIEEHYAAKYKKEQE